MKFHTDKKFKEFCIDKCPLNERMIGSINCQECVHCISFDTDQNVITCSLIDEKNLKNDFKRIN